MGPRVVEKFDLWVPEYSATKLYLNRPIIEVNVSTARPNLQTTTVTCSMNRGPPTQGVHSKYPFFFNFIDEMPKNVDVFRIIFMTGNIWVL